MDRKPSGSQRKSGHERSQSGEIAMWSFSQLPIVQAPMAGSQGPDLCVAVCEAGGLGSIPCAMLTPQLLREQIAQIRAGTKAPFNVNFFAHTPPAPDPGRESAWLQRLGGYYAQAGIDPATIPQGPGRAPYDEAMCAVIEETKPPVVSFHFGLPDEALLARTKATGAKIFSSATTVAEARWLAARGVDAIIAQGREAGGHRGMFLSDDIDAQPGLFALLPQIVDAVDVPVIAAGGVADGRGVAASFALGASAAQIGTAYLLTPQATTSAVHRAALRGAQDDATRLTNLYTGRPARGLMTRFMREQGPINPEAPAFPLATGAVTPLRSAAEKQGSGDFSPLWSGEAGSLAREADAGELTRKWWRDARAIMSGAAHLTPERPI
jgi:nitronate monooxygenase